SIAIPFGCTNWPVAVPGPLPNFPPNTYAGSAAVAPPSTQKNNSPRPPASPTRRTHVVCPSRSSHANPRVEPADEDVADKREDGDDPRSCDDECGQCEGVGAAESVEEQRGEAARVEDTVGSDRRAEDAAELE